jgi:plastocyanin
MRKLALIGLLFCLSFTACASDAEVESPSDAEQTAQTVTPTAGAATETATVGTETATAATEAPVSLPGQVENHGIGRLEGASLEMEADDFYFEPTFVQTETGASTMLMIHNEGDATHTFTIDELGIDETIEPGQEIEVEVTLPEQLPVRFFCRFHETQGMQGAFFAE